jgi:NADPH:quinone reductase-like Zn-dependent oxidoreductase
VVVHGESAAAIPEGLGLIEAATVPMNGLTVRLALDTLGLAPGSMVAISGGAGAIGGYATQLAVAEGLRVIAIVSPADEELARGLGAEAVVRRGPGAAAAIRELVADGVDGLIDAANVGGALLPAVRDGGRVIALRAFDGEPEREISVELISVRSYLRRPAELDALLRLAGRGVLTPRVAETYAPSQAAEAHRRLEAGGVRGRLVLELGAA